MWGSQDDPRSESKSQAALLPQSRYLNLGHFGWGKWLASQPKGRTGGGGSKGSGKTKADGKEGAKGGDRGRRFGKGASPKGDGGKKGKDEAAPKT